MKAAAMRHRAARRREETQPQLGERSSIDPARLCEYQRAGESIWPRGEDRSGEIEDVRPAIFSGDDIAAVQIAMGDTLRVDQFEQFLEPVEETLIKISGSEATEIATGDVLHQ